MLRRFSERLVDYALSGQDGEEVNRYLVLPRRSTVSHVWST